MSRSELQNGQPFPSLSRDTKPIVNPDGSIDILFALATSPGPNQSGSGPCRVRVYGVLMGEREPLRRTKPLIMLEQVKGGSALPRAQPTKPRSDRLEFRSRAAHRVTKPSSG